MRHLVAIAETRVLERPRVSVGVMSGPFRILEGVSGLTPFELQRTHITQETAESVAGKYPDLFRIVGEVDELERLFTL